MGENKMRNVAEMLGVELEEKFLVFCDTGEMFGTCKLNDNGLWLFDNDVMGNINQDLYKLLTDKLVIKKLPWQPKEYEHYYGYTRSSGGGVYLYEFCWKGTHVDIFNYRHGFCYKTREEAAQEANMKRARKFFNSYDIIDWEEQDNG